MKRSTPHRGLVAALAIAAIAGVAGAAAIWHNAVAVPEHLEVQTGIVCGTRNGACVVQAQPMGSGCSCARASDGAVEAGVVLPTGARGG